jgi:hypothetical protein
MVKGIREKERVCTSLVRFKFLVSIVSACCFLIYDKWIDIENLDSIKLSKKKEID